MRAPTGGRGALHPALADVLYAPGITQINGNSVVRRSAFG